MQMAAGDQGERSRLVICDRQLGASLRWLVGTVENGGVASRDGTMAETYLSVARQGRNVWWRYPLSLMLALGLTINASLYMAMPFIFGVAIRGGALPDNTVRMSEPVWFFGMTVVIGGLMAFGLALAITAIHQRPWRTVINPQGRIHWRRMGLGLVVWLGLMLLNIGLLAWADRDRYTLQFTTGWLWRWVPTLLTVPFAALMPSLVYGYLLQGLGLLIPRPIRLTAVVAVLAGLIAVVSQPTAPTAIDWATTVITAAFMVWMILQDQGLELFLGIQAASWLVQTQLVSAPDVAPFFPALLTLQSSETTWLGFITWLARLGLFYAICLLWWPRQTVEDSTDG